METGLFKVGQSWDCDRRAKSLKAASPFELKLLAVFPGFGNKERKIHEALQPYHTKNEWFKVPYPTLLSILSAYTLDDLA